MIADAARLAVGTLTRLPVAPPRAIQRTTAATAMLLAPVVGALLGLIVGCAAQLLVDHTNAAAIVAAALAFAVLAYLTRAIHLDGLADTADALGSGRPADEALAIARRSDIGPFGVVTLVAVVIVQVAAFAQAISMGVGVLALVIALGSGRLGIALACLRGIPPARTDGLGAAVAGSVPAGALIVTATAWGAVCAALAALVWTSIDPLRAVVTVVAAVAGVLVAAMTLIRTATRRLGGVTGDVLGAIVEIGTTVALVILVIGL